MKTLLSTLSRTCLAGRQERTYPWQILLDYNPDKLLAQSNHIVASSDAWILDSAARWFPLSGVIIEARQTEDTLTILLSQ